MIFFFSGLSQITAGTNTMSYLVLAILWYFLFLFRQKAKHLKMVNLLSNKIESKSSKIKLGHVDVICNAKLHTSD